MFSADFQFPMINRSLDRNTAALVNVMDACREFTIRWVSNYIHYTASTPDHGEITIIFTKPCPTWKLTTSRSKGANIKQNSLTLNFTSAELHLFRSSAKYGFVDKGKNRLITFKCRATGSSWKNQMFLMHVIREQQHLSSSSSPRRFEGS